MPIKLNYKEKVNRFIPFFYELGKERGLGANEMQVYGYLYNHCMQLNDNGWCGYSNERMADDLGMGLTQFKLYLKRLKESELIIIDNPGKRTRKTGQSRMIRINPLNYIVVEEQQTIDKAMVLKLQEELEQLKKENEKLKNRSKFVNEHVENPNWMFAGMWKRGFFTDEEYTYPNQYNALLEALLSNTDWGTCQRFIVKMGETDPKKIKDKYAYLASAVETQIRQYKERLAEEL